MSERAKPSGGAFDPNLFDDNVFDVGKLVFISHNRADREAAERVGIYLVGDGLGVWYDEWELSAGDSIVGKVDAALGACTHFLILWSEHANTSRWVREELETALSARISDGRPRVIPVVLDNAPLPTMLAKLKYVTLDDDPSIARREVIQAVTGRGPERSFAKALVELFNEVIYSPSPVGEDWNFCPRCASDNLESWGSYDDTHGQGVGITKCRDCGKQDATAEW